MYNIVNSAYFWKISTIIILKYPFVLSFTKLLFVSLFADVVAQLDAGCVQCSTVQCSAVQCSTVQCRAVQCSAELSTVGAEFIIKGCG